MEPVRGDDYLRKTAAFIRLNERGLAEAAVRPRRPRRPSQPASVLSWFVPSAPAPPRPLAFAIDTHHLFYLLIRIESLGISVGSLDVDVDSPARPMHYTPIHPRNSPETLSLASFRSSLSAVSSLSLASPWWGRPEQHPIDAELKYIYSSFTKIPALRLKAPGPSVIAELKDDPPSHSALPLDAFKNLGSLETLDIDPRTLIGWDRLAESLRSLSIRRSGLEDVTDIFIGAVLDDQARRSGSLKNPRSRQIPRRRQSWTSTPLPPSVPEESEQAPPLPAYTWALLKHLSLADNALTFLPTDPLPYLVSLTHLDLSSNLLVSVPHGLSVLHNLVSLNLSDNMIDSVLAIYTHLGQVLHLNLSSNRLESICGLERLMALERVDLRYNRIDESAEVGRLATLPNIEDVRIEGNPLTEIEDNYRIACFDFFHKEGKSISLDGTAPTFYERRGVAPVVSEQLASARDVPVPTSPVVLPIGLPKWKSDLAIATDAASEAPSSLSGGSRPTSLAVSSRPKKRKVKRIVDFNADGEQHVFSPVASPITLPLVAGSQRPSSTSPQRSSPLSPDGGHRRSYSAFEPPDSSAGESDSQTREGELYRARIEALRSDMGDGWLKVFSQSQVHDTT